MKIVLLSKSDEWSRRAYEIGKAALGDELLWHRVTPHDKFEGIEQDSINAYPYIADAIISFLCPWVIPDKVLKNMKLAINFHPAPVEYPGTGCYNFAIYDRAKEYGATCHHMAAKVDSGPIIDERRFPMLPDDTVAGLKERTMAVMLGMFAQVVADIAAGKDLPKSNKQWTRKAYRRKQLDELAKLSPDMSQKEIDLRTRATTYGNFKPQMMVAGRTFQPVTLDIVLPADTGNRTT